METEADFVAHWCDAVVVVVTPEVPALHTAFVRAGLALETLAFAPLRG